MESLRGLKCLALRTSPIGGVRRNPRPRPDPSPSMVVMAPKPLPVRETPGHGVSLAGVTVLTLGMLLPLGVLGNMRWF